MDTCTNNCDSSYGRTHTRPTHSALMHHFCKDEARRLTGQLSPIMLLAPYSTRCISLIASWTLSIRNKVDDKFATSGSFCCSNFRARARARDSFCVCKINTLGKKTRPNCRFGIEGHGLTSRWIAIEVIHRCTATKNLSSMTRLSIPSPSRDPLRIASVTRTSQLKRTVNASVYHIHQTEDGKRVKKRLTSPLPRRVAKGWRCPLECSPRSALAQKCIFFRRDIDELTISADMG